MPRVSLLVATALVLSVGLALLDPNVLTAIATAVLTVFAGLQIISERAKRRSEERTADARLSAQAFQVRQVLAALILESQKTGWYLGWVEQTLASAPQIRRRLERALAVASHATPVVATRVQRAYVLYERALTRLEPVRASWAGFPPEAQSFTMAEQGQLSDAREDLRGCCNELEGALSAEILAEAKRLGALTAV